MQYQLNPFDFPEIWLISLRRHGMMATYTNLKSKRTFTQFGSKEDWTKGLSRGVSLPLSVIQLTTPQTFISPGPIKKIMRQSTKILNALAKLSDASNQPTPLRWLTQRLSLMSNLELKDKVINSDNQLHELVRDHLSKRYESCTRGCCWGSNLGPADPKDLNYSDILLPLNTSNFVDWSWFHYSQCT